MKYPRLYVNGNFSRIIHPISVSITQKITPLSTASITLAPGEELPERSYVELFTPYGSAGMFRVSSPADVYGNGTSTAELEHMISDVGNYIVKEEASEMIGASDAIRRAFSYYKGNYWAIGTVSAIGSEKVAYEVKYDRVLDVILSILQQRPDCMLAFNFSSLPWKFNIVKKGTAVSAEGRLSRNVNTATITYDDSELITRAWYQVFDKNHKGTWKSRDASTKSKYGIIEGTVRTTADMTTSEISYAVDTYLKEHMNPRISVNIQAAELSQITGESMDKFVVGQMLRLAFPDYNTTLTEVITSVTWNDVYNNPGSVAVNLGQEEDTVVTFLHNLDAKGSGGGGGGGGAKKKKEDEWSEFISDWDVQKDHISGMVARQDRTGKILEQAGLVITSGGIETYAKKKDVFSIITQTAEGINETIKNTKKGLETTISKTAEGIEQTVSNTVEGLQSQITSSADKISLVVGTTSGGENYIKPAEIVASINNGASTIKLSADHINIDGLVQKLESQSIGVGSLSVEGGTEFKSTVYGESTITAEDNIRSNSKLIGIEGVQVGNSYTATWQSKTFTTYNLSSTSHAFVYRSGGNDYTTLGWLVTSTGSTTINYLGR